MSNYEKFDLQAGNIKLCTQKEEWISIWKIVFYFTYVFIYIMHNKNILMIIRGTFIEKAIFDMDTALLFLAYFLRNELVM
jgi:hypothetical protein